MLTEIVAIVDRSGSMSATRVAAENGLNEFIAEQKKAAGECYITVHEFDDRFETPVPRQDITWCPKYHLTPRASTALFDAVGRGVSAIPLSSTNVVVIVVTDGGENASREWTGDSVKKLIQARQELGWKFIFIGAGISAYAGQQMGFDQSLANSGTGKSFTQTYGTLSSSIMNTRNAGVAYGGLSGAESATIENS